MKKTNIRRFYYHFRHDYLTMNNVVVAVALVIGAGWAWGSVGVMQRNYELQKEIDTKKKQLTLVQLQKDTLSYQQKYYESDEYKELSVRQHLGLAEPGESVLILPPNSAAANAAGRPASQKPVAPPTEPSNFQQWINFLFGGDAGK